MRGNTRAERCPHPCANGGTDVGANDTPNDATHHDAHARTNATADRGTDRRTITGANAASL